MTEQPHWFADIDRDAPPQYQWQPCLETHAGLCPSLPVWFSTRKECEEWIASYVIGAQLEVS